jgi:hypothetical protein
MQMKATKQGCISRLKYKTIKNDDTKSYLFKTWWNDEAIDPPPCGGEGFKYILNLTTYSNAPNLVLGC